MYVEFKYCVELMSQSLLPFQKFRFSTKFAKDVPKHTFWLIWSKRVCNHELPIMCWHCHRLWTVLLTQFWSWRIHILYIMDICLLYMHMKYYINLIYILNWQPFFLYPVFTSPTCMIIRHPLFFRYMSIIGLSTQKELGHCDLFSQFYGHFSVDVYVNINSHLWASCEPRLIWF